MASGLGPLTVGSRLAQTDAIGGRDQPLDPVRTIVSNIEITDDGKGYLTVDGAPFLMLGVQAFGEWQRFGNFNDRRPDQTKPILDQDWLENMFDKTAAAGFRTIQLMLAWNQIEPKAPGQYNWELLDKYIQWAEKYDLRIDWVWWGINGCQGGIIPNASASYQTEHGFMTSVPEYAWDLERYWGRGISENEQVLPFIPVAGTRDPEQLRHIVDAEFLFECERLAVSAMFHRLATIDRTHRSILFQVWNEPNFHPDWTQHNDIWLSLADSLAKSVKDAPYVVATRMNYLTADNRVDPLHGNPTNCPHIDFFGPDIYTWDPFEMKAALEAASPLSPILTIPETYANNPAITSILLTILASGGFVNFWQLNDCWGHEFALWGDFDINRPEYLDWTVGTIPARPEAVQRLNRLLPGSVRNGRRACEGSFFSNLLV